MKRYAPFPQCIAAVVLFGATRLIFAATATDVVPRVAPRGARCVVVGSGLDGPGIAVTFATSAGSASASIVERFPGWLEVMVPSSAVSGSARVSDGAAVLGTFPFSVSADPPIAKVVTVVVSGAGREPVKGPRGNASRADGSAYIADTMHHQIAVVSPNGTLSVYAGSGRGGLLDGPRAVAEFRGPEGIVYDASRGILYIADTDNHAIRRITPDGMVTTLAGSGRRGDRDGAGTNAEFTLPTGVSVDAQGNIYVADTGNHRIKRITPDGVVTTIAGTGAFGATDGPARQAGFHSPEGIAVAADGSIFVADTGNDVVRRIAAGIVTTISGGARPGYVDGPAGAASFSSPIALAFDDLGNVIIADTRNQVIRKLTLTPGAPVVSTVAGNGSAGLTDGTGLNAQFRNPSGVSAPGAIVVSDTSNDAIRILYPQLVATDVYPRIGDPSGGDTIRLFGTGFVAGQTSVVVGGSPAQQVNVLSSTTLTVVTPPGAFGSSVISVSTPAGTSTLAGVFSYVPPFISLGVIPANSSLDPGQSLQLHALGSLPAGGTTDVTNRAVWTSSNANVATVSASGEVHAAQPGSATITATLGALSAAATVDVRTPVPPDPETVATALDPSAAVDLFKDTSFLYSGPTPIQQGVAPGTIDPKRVSILRGRVLTRSGLALPGVRVTIAEHGEFGSTISRADGAWDMVVNGGGSTAVVFQKAGYATAERAVTPAWRAFAFLEDVALVETDSNATPISANSGALQVARGSMVDDAAGVRRGTVIIAPNTGAVATLPNGSQQTLASLTLRVTEYTVGPSGPQAMPAPLPVSSGYTYCVELSVDEATALGSRSLVFDRPLYYYVENFLGIPVGTRVPSGYYDRDRHAWVPDDDGRVIAIVGVVNGRATVDINGDGNADGDAAMSALGFSPAELEKLATLYAPGTSLWRAPLVHFSPHDLNFPFDIPADAAPPSVDSASARAGCLQDSACQAGSIIECENQTLGESLPVTGTPWTLNYRSDRVKGRRGARQLIIPLSGTTIPPSLKHIELEVTVAGQRFLRQFPALPNQTFTWEWDGRDAYGRAVNGRFDAKVRIGYAYPLYYKVPTGSGRAFAQFGSATAAPIASPFDITQWQEDVVQLGVFEPIGFGGWTLSAQHAYQPDAGTLLFGDGRQKLRAGMPSEVVRIAGSRLASSFSGVPAQDAVLFDVRDMAYGPDGSLYVLEDTMVARIDLFGILNVIVNLGNTRGYSGDGGPAVNARIDPSDRSGIAVGADGSLYIADLNNFRIRRVDASGIISTFAGNGTFDALENVPALQTGMAPVSVEAGPDGSVYYGGGGVVRKITPDGMIRTVAGFGLGENPGLLVGPSQPMRSPALQTWMPPYVDELQFDGEGNLYIIDGYRLLVLHPNGLIDTVAGRWQQGGASPSTGDGGPALSATFDSLHSVVPLPDHTLLVTEHDYVRRIGADGVITRFAGGGTDAQYGFGPLLGTFYYDPRAVLSPGGDLIVSSRGAITRVSSSLPRYDFQSISFPEADGSLVYRFDGNGRHLETLQGATLERIYGLEYDTNGALAAVADWYGRRTEITRSGSTIGIRAPGGAVTVLQIGADGFAESVRTPAGKVTRFTYSPDGLMRSFTSPGGRTASFNYDDAGLLVQHSDAARTRTLERTATAMGEELAVRSSSGRVWRYLRERPAANGNSRRVFTDASGLTLTTVVSSDLSGQTAAGPGNVSAATTSIADARFGLLVPVTSATLHVGAGLDQSVTASRELSLNASRQITQQLDTRAVGDRTFTANYFPLNRLATITTPAGRTITQTLDLHQQVVRSEVAGIAPVMLEYDEAGQLRAIMQGGRTLLLERDINGEVLSRTVGTMRTTYQHDLDGRLTSTLLPGNRNVSFGYDGDGQLVSLTPPGRGAYRFEYNASGLVEKYTSPGGATTRLAYTADGDLTSITQPDQSMIVLQYDGRGLLSRVDSSEGSYSLTYDSNGNIATLGSPAGIILNYSWNGAAATGITWSGAVAGTVSFAYDNALHVSSEVVNGVPVSFAYDRDGLLSMAGALRLRRDASNGLLSGSSLGSMTDTVAYDSFGAPSTITVTAGAALLYSVSYSRNTDGRITSSDEIVEGSGVSYGYEYDSAGRLARIRQNGVAVAEYDYDDNGNRVAYRVVGAAGSALYDADDRLLTYGDAAYAYDAAGQVSQKMVGGETTAFTYDAFGALIRVAIPGRLLEYVNDGEHRRVAKKVNGVMTQQFLYEDGVRIVAELSSTGQLRSRFVYGSRPNVPDYMIRDGHTYRVVCDLIGSVRLVADAADGVVAQRLSYDAFGKVVTDTNPGFQPFGFAGGLYDGDTGLVRFGARDYDPHVGRWTAKDPIGFGGGSTNLYSYAFNDPVNFADPNGMLTLPFIGWVDAGEGFGSSALESYADVLIDPNAAWYEVAGAAVGGFFSALWTPCTSDATFTTLSSAYGANTVLKSVGTPYWRYVGPKSNPNSRWLARGLESPYGTDFARAKDALQLPNLPNEVRPVNVRWWEPVRGPRSATLHPEWGTGGGSEYFRGWRWPE